MSNEQELLRRVERLEKQNNRWRAAGILLCLIACGLATMAQKTAKKASPRTVEAGAVVIKDEKGAARIRVTPKGIEFLGADGKFAGAIREDITILNEIKAAELTVFDTGGKDRIRLALNGERPLIQMMNENGAVRTAMGQEAIVLLGNTQDEYNSMTFDRITIRDAAASNATVGVTEMVDKTSGQRTKTSAGTITLFGKDGRVVWQAP